ncbi:unnamed protein product [Brassicogethes aeneus]|uniref:Uncharacterized protein n=1 Tax=Brassicogethes aeneus TaxID=1431903 RepID=A0A9P0B7Z9_BRAAE|nr:unnamed protein product [Brassicogethes aeneus]
MSEADSSSNLEDFSDEDPDYKPSSDEGTSNTNLGSRTLENYDSDNSSVEENIAQSLSLLPSEIDVMAKEVSSYDLTENNTADVIAEELTSNGQYENNTAQQENVQKKLTRKRKRDVGTWKRVVNKNLCEHGKEYTDVKGRKRRQREVFSKKDCDSVCKFKCSKIISTDERLKIHGDFWKLNNESKLHFYNTNTGKSLKKRKTVENSSRRIFSYQYYFNILAREESPISMITKGKKLRVCQYHPNRANTQKK